MPVNYQPVLVDMVEAARRAGALTLQHFSHFRDFEVGIKGPADFVTEADRQAELLIRDFLMARYPDWSFSGEEFAPVEGRDREHRWLVDPIDGTTNFVNGMPYMISIALRRGDETVCGVLLNPVANELFTAVAGRGAFLNSKRLTVGSQSDPALMAFGTGLALPDLPTFPGFYDRLASITAAAGAVRAIGSSANSCAHVACGRLSGYFEQAGLIDWAVGVLLVEEAGGIVTDWWGRGSEHYERSGIVIVATRPAHAYLLEQLSSAPVPLGA